MSSSIKLKNANGKTVSVTNSNANQTDKEIIYLNTVDELANASGSINAVAIVSDLSRGGTFEWSATGTANGGTVFAGITGYWTRQYSGAVSVKWFGAKGDGITDDTLAISSLEAVVKNEYVNLFGGTYVVTAMPTNNTYINGYFSVSGIIYDSVANDGMIASLNDTGGYVTAYSGGVLHIPTTKGRTTPALYSIIASQNCRSEGVSKAVNIGSIYSHAKGSVSGNYSSRHSLAWVPQSANLASEECRVVGGFRGANIASIYSACENESNINLACRGSYSSARNSSNLSSTNCFAGRGGGAMIIAHTSGGVLVDLTLAVGNDGTTIFSGRNYVAGSPLTFFDTINQSPVLPVATIGTVDDNGAILTFSISSVGSGLSGEVAVHVDDGFGDFSANIASSSTQTRGETSANIASYNQITSGLRSASIASQGGTTSGQNAGQLASNLSVSSGAQSAVIASNAGYATGVGSTALACNNSQATADGSVVIGRRTINNVVRSIAFGDSSSGEPLTANRKFHIFSNGNVQASGTFSGSSTFTDYAEYFENLTEGIIPLGTIVELDGAKVKRANGTAMLGVISATALIAAGDSPFCWSGRYLTGEFGELLYEDIAMVKWDSYDGLVSEATDIPDNAEYYTELHPKENPEFSKDITTYLSRSERPSEWSLVGLIGQLHVRIDGTLNVGDYVTAIDGIGSIAEEKTSIRVMKIKKEFDGDYGVALCIVK